MSPKGYSMIMWAVVFSAVLASLVLFRATFKRGLQNKIIGSTDYLIWEYWGNTTDQYKGDESSHVKSHANQQQDLAIRDMREKTVEIHGVTTKTEDSASASVEQGSEAVLKLYDLNQEVP
jgi:hypothetical protein